MKHLRLNHNEFEGSLPTQLARLDKLEWLALHHNRLTGELPAELLNGLGLKYLELHSNEFQGTLPSAITSMADLGMSHHCPPRAFRVCVVYVQGTLLFLPHTEESLF